MLSVAVTLCVEPIASRRSSTRLEEPGTPTSGSSGAPARAGSASPATSEYTCTMRSAINSASLTSSTRSTLQLRSPRIDPSRT